MASLSTYLDLIEDEDSQAHNKEKQAQDWTSEKGLPEEADPGRCVAVAMGGHKQSAHVLPHDVEHGRSKEAVLDVEGIQVEVALLEDLADGCAAGAWVPSGGACTLCCGEKDTGWALPSSSSL